MNKEEIENRIRICENRMRDNLEVANTRMIEKYQNEIHKWEKILEQLNPEMEQELRNYKVAYNRLNDELIKAKQTIENLEEENDMLKYEIEHLKEEMQNREQDIEDNYERKDAAEQYDVSDRDFIDSKYFTR